MKQGAVECLVLARAALVQLAPWSNYPGLLYFNTKIARGNDTSTELERNDKWQKIYCAFIQWKHAPREVGLYVCHED